MAFAGSWETETQEGYDDFCQLIGIPDDIIEKGRDYQIVTDIIHNGDDFAWTQTYPENTKITYNFTIGQECSMQTIGGKRFNVTVNMEEDKLRVHLPNFNQISELSGNKLIERLRAGSKVMTRTSRRI